MKLLGWIGVLILICLGLIGLAVWAVVGSFFGVGPVTPALDNLQRVSVLEQLGRDAESADLIVFQDGEAGWFVVNPPSLLDGVEIGFFGPRIGDAIFGATHIPLYCSEDRDSGKVIWSVRNATLDSQLAYCNKRRMDLSELRPLAAPVSMHSEYLLREEIEAFARQLETDTDKTAVTLPTTFQPYDFTRKIEMPAIWYRWNSDDLTRMDAQDLLETALNEHLGDLSNDVSVQFIGRSAAELTRYVENGSGSYSPSETGPAIALDDKTYIMTEINWVERIEMTIQCTPLSCPAIDGFDPLPILREARDLGLLERAQTGIIEIEGRESGPQDLTFEQLMDESFEIGPMVPQRYLVRWISPRN